MAPKMPSFAGDPIYAASVAEANRTFQETLGNIGTQQQHLLLQLGNPQLARAIYSTNWLRSRTKNKPGYSAHPPHGSGYTTHQITPFERNQLRAINAASDPMTGTSTMAKIGRQFNLQQEALNNELNAANLFYSGYRGKQLGELGREKQFAETEALTGAQNTLDTQNTALMQARQQRRDAILHAAQSAYQIMLANQLGRK